MRLRLLFLCFLITIAAHGQQIALTFDDAPLGDGPMFSGEERANKIIDALKINNVEQAAFFVVTGHISDSSGLNRLKKYQQAGHLLANHTHSHNWIRVMGTANYIRDIEKADSTLTRLAPYKKWFRYPFLDEGRSKGSRDSIRTALSRLNLTNAYITVDNYDWYLNGALRTAVVNNKQVNIDLLRELYIEHIWTSIQFYDNIGKTVLNRSPKHVLLLHENDLAALFLSDLIQFLKAKGWQIISPEEAYTDPIAGEIPDVLFNGQGRIGAIAYAKGLKPAQLVQQSEDETYLDNVIAEKKVFTSK